MAISGKSTKYAVTGIVNAPAMAAASSADNAPWIELAKRLGLVAGKLASRSPQPVPIESRTAGPDMAQKKFLHTALQVGLVAASGQTQGLNLVNAPNLAKELGIQVNEGHESADRNMLVVKAGSHVVKGLYSVLKVDGFFSITNFNEKYIFCRYHRWRGYFLAVY